MGTLYHMLPGYPAMPLQARIGHPRHLDRITPAGGYWVNTPKFIVSQLKAWWGDAATRENDYAYDYLPKREMADAYSHQHFMAGMRASVVQGFHLPGPRSGGRQPERQDGSGGDAQPEMAGRRRSV